MEFMCPVCGSWTEIHEHQVFTCNRFKCQRCWGQLRIESARPFRIMPDREPEKQLVRVGSGMGHKEEENG